MNYSRNMRASLVPIWPTRVFGAGARFYGSLEALRDAKAADFAWQLPDFQGINPGNENSSAPRQISESFHQSVSAHHRANHHFILVPGTGFDRWSSGSEPRAAFPPSVVF